MDLRKWKAWPVFPATAMILIALSVVSLAACSHAPPSCSNSDATDIVKQIVTEQLDKKKAFFVGLNTSNKAITYDVALKDIRTDSKDESTGDYKCEATVDVTSNSFMFNKSTDITYTTEVTEDTKKPYVTVYGFGD